MNTEGISEYVLIVHGKTVNLFRNSNVIHGPIWRGRWGRGKIELWKCETTLTASGHHPWRISMSINSRSTWITHMTATGRYPSRAAKALTKQIAGTIRFLSGDVK